MRFTWILPGSLLALSAAAPSAAFDTFSETVAGSSCSQNTPAYTNGSQMDCEFRIGKSLHFVLVGVGGADAVFTVFKADFDGDYYASFAATNRTHDCAIVKPGHTNPRLGDYAFVSPRTAHVFRTWQECKGH